MIEIYLTLNTKILKYLTNVFSALPIKKCIWDCYYERIKAFLIEKFKLINDHLKKTNGNKETKSYIYFSYKYITWYFRFHISCKYCKTLYTIMLVNNYNICGKCKPLIILETPKPPLKLFTSLSFFH